jgi:hypothetical protein
MLLSLEPLIFNSTSFILHPSAFILALPPATAGGSDLRPCLSCYLLVL